MDPFPLCQSLPKQPGHPVHVRGLFQLGRGQRQGDGVDGGHGCDLGIPRQQLRLPIFCCLVDQRDPHARVGFSAKGQFRRSDFGVSYGIPAPGTTFGVGDEVAVTLESEFSGPPLRVASR